MEYVTVGDERVPALGLGTWNLRDEACEETVGTALELGYRHIDTARMYGNERAVGAAIAGSTVDSDELFVTTKIRRSELEADAVSAATRDSRDALGLDAIDLLLIHSPSDTVPIAETVEAMNDLQTEGVVRHIGVSNFSVSQLETAIDASETPILTNQVEYHPFTDRGDLLAFCIENGVVLTAYSPLAEGSRRVFENETLRDIGEAHEKTPAQVALRWLVQQETVAAIPKASSREHLAANLAVFDFSLTDAEMERIFDLQGGLYDRVRAALGL